MGPFLGKRAIVLVLLLIATSPVSSIQIQVTGGGSGWVSSVPPANLPSGAGRDLTVTTYSSSASQTVLRIRENPGGWMWRGRGWVVTVSKVSTGWYPGLHLFIQRTSHGWPEDRLTGPYFAYIEVPEKPATVEFFRCPSQTEISAINCQLQIRGVSVAAGKTNQTTVFYTVTEF